MLHVSLTPFGEMNVTLTDQGIESVTVLLVPIPMHENTPVISARVLGITFWVAAGFPVPVRYQFPNKYLEGVDPFQSYELKGRGST